LFCKTGKVIFSPRVIKNPYEKILSICLCILIILPMMTGCAARKRPWTYHSPPRPRPLLNLMEYTIQAGAFRKVENAVRLTEKLRINHGLDATYFLASDKLFKVRFGNFPSKEQARQVAQRLVNEKVIEEFYIVQPEDYAVAKEKIWSRLPEGGTR